MSIRSVPFRLDGHTATLEPDNTLVGDGIRTKLTKGQAAVARAQPDQIEEQAQRFIDEPEAAQVQLASRHPGVIKGPEAEALARERSALAAEQSVMLDTTTVRNAVAALNPKKAPSAIELLDLNVLTVAATCFERVVLQPDVEAYDRTGQRLDHIDVPLSAEWIRTLKLDQDQREDIARLHRRAVSEVQAPTQADRWKHDWAEFLKLKPEGVKLGFKYAADYRRDDWIPPTEVTANFLAAKPLANDMWAHEFLGMQTVRTHFNDIVAGHLRVPYMASVFRAPVYAQLARSKHGLLDLIGRLLPSVGEQQTASIGDPQTTKVPFLLGRLLSRMLEPTEYWSEIRELRRECEPLRTLLGQRDIRTEDVVAELHRCASRYVDGKELAVAGIIFGANLPTGNPVPTIGAGARLVAAALSTPKARQWLLKRRRPGLYALVTLALDAPAIKSLQEQVERVWQAQPEPHTEADLNRIAGFQIYQFQKTIRM
jgi:hypothetical protein